MMKISTKNVKNIKITEVDNLDLINVYLEDIAPRQGRIIIECYGESWSSYWGGMGDRTISEFVCRCDHHYLAKNLSSIPSRVVDYDNLDQWFWDEIIRQRLNGEISKSKAREFWDEVQYSSENSDRWLNSSDGHGLCMSVFGDDFWYQYPEIANHEYVYLCGIIDTVKEALKMEGKK